MIQEIRYNTISHVIESWEQLRRIKNYEQIAGVRLFQRLFTECAEAKVLFGFAITVDPSSKEVLKSRRLIAHASHWIQMIDSSLNLLGPDTELLQEILMELGSKHVYYGVTPRMFLVMGQCLVETLEEILAEYQSEFHFTQTVKDAWVETYAILSNGMLQAYDQH